MIVGPSSPNPVQFSARLTLQLRAFGGSQTPTISSGSLEEGGRPPVSASANSIHSPSINTVVVLPVTHRIDEPFELTYQVSCGATGPASGSAGGALSFHGLPPGYGIISCQGFGGVVVPTASRTWGAVKAIYR
jgi:hypothetical protein